MRLIARRKNIMKRILVSRCLLGDPVRHDGGSRPLRHPLLQIWREQGRLVPLCPEVEGGLPVPRPPCEIVTGRVRTASGEDVSQAFLRGAEAAVRLARRQGCAFALLKERSPSCGVHRVYDGGFRGRLVAGRGLTAARLAEAGIAVFSEDEITDLARAIERAEEQGREK